MMVETRNSRSVSRNRARMSRRRRSSSSTDGVRSTGSNGMVTATPPSPVGPFGRQERRNVSPISPPWFGQQNGASTSPLPPFWSQGAQSGDPHQNQNQNQNQQQQQQQDGIVFPQKRPHFRKRNGSNSSVQSFSDNLNNSVGMIDRPRPTPEAFKAQGELRRKNHGDILMGLTPVRRICPPTPRRSAFSTCNNNNNSGINVGMSQSDGKQNYYHSDPCNYHHKFRRVGDSPLATSREVIFKSRELEELGGGIPELRVMGEIGQGNFGSVYLVREEVSKSFYALKQNKVRLESKESKSYHDFLRTTKAWGNMDPHPNVVRLYGAWMDDGLIRMLMELGQGGNLIHYVDACMRDHEGKPTVPWAEDQIWRCLGDAARGLAHIHESGFCHNDIKPWNLFIGDDDNNNNNNNNKESNKQQQQDGQTMMNHRGNRKLMIGDFGLLREQGESEIDDEEGDFKYISRDALEGHATPASDIFSLGISFYEVVADVELPEVGMWHQLRAGEMPPLPSYLSPDLFQLLKKMMNPNPSSRPTAHDICNHPKVRQFANVPLAPSNLYVEMLRQDSGGQHRQHHNNNNSNYNQHALQQQRDKTPEHYVYRFPESRFANTTIQNRTLSSSSSANIIRTASIPASAPPPQSHQKRLHIQTDLKKPTTDNDGDEDLLDGDDAENISPRRCLLNDFMDCV